MAHISPAVYRAKRAGARYALRIYIEAKRAKVPYSWALALVEQETGFQNVFGHDPGGMFPGLRVTKARVKTLVAAVRAGHLSNGVGLTQLTWPPYIYQAEAAGGAHRPAVQIRVGLRVFRSMTGGDFAGKAWKYNGSPRYQAQIAAKQRRWHKIVS